MSRRGEVYLAIVFVVMTLIVSAFMLSVIGDAQEIKPVVTLAVPVKSRLVFNDDGLDATRDVGCQSLVLTVANVTCIGNKFRVTVAWSEILMIDVEMEVPKSKPVAPLKR